MHNSMFWIYFFLSIYTIGFLNLSYYQINGFEVDRFILFLVFTFLGYKSIEKKEIKSFQSRKDKSIKWYKMYFSSNYKNKGLLETIAEMNEVYLGEIKKSKNKKIALKKSINILKRDFFEIFRFILYLIIGTTIGAIILMIVFAVYMSIYNYSNN